jgi:hypothetical protein
MGDPNDGWTSEKDSPEALEKKVEYEVNKKDRVKIGEQYKKVNDLHSEAQDDNLNEEPNEEEKESELEDEEDLDELDDMDDLDLDDWSWDILPVNTEIGIMGIIEEFLKSLLELL